MDGIAGDAVTLKVLRVIAAQPDRQADPLKAGIVGPFRHSLIGESCDDLFRNGIAAGEIVYGDGTVINRYTKEQNFKVR